jgi:hypothetical protein
MRYKVTDIYKLAVTLSRRKEINNLIQQMIKEFFEIETTQKNSLIAFLGVLCVSFLQLYLFKRNIIETNTFLAIGLSLGMSVCWIIIQIPGYYMFLDSSDENINNSGKTTYDKVPLGFGVMLLIWMLLLTYIAYELNLSLKTFIRLVISIMFLRLIFWFFYSGIKRSKKGK